MSRKIGIEKFADSNSLVTNVRSLKSLEAIRVILQPSEEFLCERDFKLLVRLPRLWEEAVISGEGGGRGV